MSVELRAIYLPFIFIAFIIGYQMSFYFIYHYRKFREKKIEINKILLFYGILYFCLLTGYLFDVINDFYIEDVFFNDVFIRMSYFFFILGLIIFLFFIISKEFNSIINPQLGKIVIVLNFILLLILFLIHPTSDEFQIMFIFLIIPNFYILIFQIKLIKLSSGNIKKRLILIFLGEVISSLSIILRIIQVGQFSTQLANPFIAISFIFSLILGLIIISVGLLKFPVFLEFYWKNNLISLFIIERKTLKNLYSYDFTTSIENGINSKHTLSNIDEHIRLISNEMLGILDVFTAVTDTKDEKVKIIKQGEFSILLEYGEDPIAHVFFILLVRGEMNSYRYFLKTIKNQFEGMYKYIIPNFKYLNKSNIDKLFFSFDSNIKNILTTN